MTARIAAACLRQAEDLWCCFQAWRCRPARKAERRTALRLEGLEERWTPATVTWSAAAPGSWFTAANWSTGTVPTAADDVQYDGTSIKDCSVPAAGAVAKSLNVLVGYTGTLTLSSSLTVGAGLSVLRGGTILQNAGAVLQFGGNVGLSGTAINVPSSHVARAPQSFLVKNGTVVVSAIASFDFGDTLNLVGATLSLVPSKDVHLWYGGNWNIDAASNATAIGAGGNLVLSDSNNSIIFNQGTFAVSKATADSMNIGLGFENTALTSQLLIHINTVTFSGTTATGQLPVGPYVVVPTAAIYQALGLTQIDNDATLDMAAGDRYYQDGGTFQSIYVGNGVGNTAYVSGSVYINGGQVLLNSTGYNTDTGTIKITGGSFTMMGGTYFTNVDAADPNFRDQIQADGAIRLGGSATLWAVAIDTGGGIPKGQQWDVLVETSTATISGDFATVKGTPNVFTGAKSADGTKYFIKS